MELIAKAVAPPATVLDLAAAQGNFSLILSELGYAVTWNDLRADLVDYVKLKYECGDLRFVPGNAFELRFNQQFDLVLVMEVIEHVAHPDEFLVRVASLVKPGGYVVMTTPNGDYFRNKLPSFSEHPDPAKFESDQFKPNSDGHIFLLHVDELEALARNANLDVLDVGLFTNPLTNGHVGFYRLLPFVPRSVVAFIERWTERLPMFMRRKLHTGMAVLLKRRISC